MSIEISEPAPLYSDEDLKAFGIDTGSLLDHQPLWQESITLALKETIDKTDEELVADLATFRVGYIATQEAFTILKSYQ